MPHVVTPTKNPSPPDIQKKQSVVTRQQSLDEHRQYLNWLQVGRLLCYPDLCIEFIRTDLEKKGKMWEWNAAQRSDYFEIDGKAEELEPRVRATFRTALLMIGATTSSGNMRSALKSLARASFRISVVYVERRLLMDGKRTEGEVDSWFNSEFERGNRKLREVERVARCLSMEVQTSFIWANSLDEVINQTRRGDTASFAAVVDARDIPV